MFKLVTVGTIMSVAMAAESDYHPVNHDLV